MITTSDHRSSEKLIHFCSWTSWLNSKAMEPCSAFGCKEILFWQSWWKRFLSAQIGPRMPRTFAKIKRVKISCKLDFWGTKRQKFCFWAELESLKVHKDFNKLPLTYHRENLQFRFEISARQRIYPHCDFDERLTSHVISVLTSPARSLHFIRIENPWWILA